MLARDAEFSDVVAGSMQLIIQLADTVRAPKEIAELAYTSAVTGLRNKRALVKDIEPFVAGGTPFKVVSIDMDGLKIINDTFGHQAGNEALNNLGQRLSLELGEQDTAYHVSGDEFYVVTREMDVDYVEDLM